MLGTPTAGHLFAYYGAESKAHDSQDANLGPEAAGVVHRRLACRAERAVAPPRDPGMKLLVLGGLGSLLLRLKWQHAVYETPK